LIGVNLEKILWIRLEHCLLAWKESAFPPPDAGFDDLNPARAIRESVSFHCVLMQTQKKNLSCLMPSLSLVIPNDNSHCQGRGSLVLLGSSLFLAIHF
jgi:hypothetical protein